MQQMNNEFESFRNDKFYVSVDLEGEVGLIERLKQTTIDQAVEMHDGSKLQAAKLLGVTNRTIYKREKKRIDKCGKHLLHEQQKTAIPKNEQLDVLVDWESNLWNQVYAEAIRKVMLHHGCSKSGVAKKIGIRLETLTRKLEEFDILPENLNGESPLQMNQYHSGTPIQEKTSRVLFDVSVDIEGEGSLLKRLQKATIEKTLALLEDKKELAASILGLSLSSLYRKLTEYELEGSISTAPTQFCVAVQNQPSVWNNVYKAAIEKMSVLENGKNVSTARRLGISGKTLYNKMIEFGLRSKPVRAPIQKPEAA